jgi:hypothetical protein
VSRGKVYACVTGGCGVYEVHVELRDGDVGGGWQPTDPLYHPDPLTQLALHELLASVAKPGGYDTALLAGGD